LQRSDGEVREEIGWGSRGRPSQEASLFLRTRLIGPLQPRETPA
jgi:hypothetical protein